MIEAVKKENSYFIAEKSMKAFAHLRDGQKIKKKKKTNPAAIANEYDDACMNGNGTIKTIVIVVIIKSYSIIIIIIHH